MTYIGTYYGTVRYCTFKTENPPTAFRLLGTVPVQLYGKKL